MTLKLQLREDEEDFEAAVDRPKRQRSSTFNALLDVEDSDLLGAWEALARKCVREELEFRLNLHPRVECSGRRPLKLHFLSKVPATLFTNSSLLSEEKSNIKLVLCDSNSKEIVQSHPLSNTKVSVVVLDGVFGSDGVEDWKKEDFVRKIVHRREGKRPLIIGESVVQLKNGVGYIGEISFTDNSKWTWNGKFRLGAIAQTNSDQIMIREGITNAFQVKDIRGMSYQKHDIPSLSDPVWRLEKIAKDGAYHKRLSKYGIHSVKDLLQAAEQNKDFLLKTVLAKISEKMWKVIIGHANCALVDSKNSYMNANCDGLLSYSVGQDLCPWNYYDETQPKLTEHLKKDDPLITNSVDDYLIPNPDLELPDGLNCWIDAFHHEDIVE